MLGDDPLKTALVELLHELRGSGIRPLIGGGYGLFLKQEYLAKRDDVRTLFPIDAWPSPRATNDIDVLLRPEIVTDSNSMAALRRALDRLGFVPVEAAKYYQFERPVGGGRAVKIDLLAGPLGVLREKVKVDARRVHPRPTVGLHAHPVEEAVAYERGAIEIPVEIGSSGSGPSSGQVLVPQGFTYSMMKLFAFRDTNSRNERIDAQHHALDAYRIVAMLSEGEYATAKRLSAELREDEYVREARRIVGRFFSAATALGVLRVREHPLFGSQMRIAEWIEVLRELFPPID